MNGNAEVTARIFGCTVDQAKALYRKNATELRRMAAQPNCEKRYGMSSATLLAKAAEFAQKGK